MSNCFGPKFHCKKFTKDLFIKVYHDINSRMSMAVLFRIENISKPHKPRRVVVKLSRV